MFLLTFLQLYYRQI